MHFPSLETVIATQKYHRVTTALEGKCASCLKSLFSSLLSIFTTLGIICGISTRGVDPEQVTRSGNLEINTLGDEVRKNLEKKHGKMMAFLPLWL